MSPLNTAILYDIENLIGGYHKADRLSNLSLQKIYDEILQKNVDQIAIQKAYANWSDNRLSVLKNDIVKLGIEPVQMFGFGRGPQKNASDIQLVIDAIDIAWSRPSIKKFVIVSGDGGFSALAKKLHEHGLFVIGCAFKKTTNKVFSAVCDEFIWIDDPDSQSDHNSNLTDPILVDYAKKFKPNTFERNESIQEAKNILKFLAHHQDAFYLLNDKGMNISVLSQALSYRIKDFNYHLFGFTRFVDFIRYITTDSDLKLVHNPPSEYRLLFKHAFIPGFSDVPPIRALSEIHTEFNYRLLLGRHSPILKLPNRQTVHHICTYLAENKSYFQGLYLEELIDRLDELGYDQTDIKNTLLSLISAGCFLQEPEEGKLSEQKFYFIPQNTAQSLDFLKQAMHKKLSDLLDRVDESILEQIIRVDHDNQSTESKQSCA